MPNGYTADIYEGKEGADSARAYLWKCVRGFGVCIEQRDDDYDAPIKLPDLSNSYNVKSLAEDKAQLETLLARSDEEWQALYDQYIAEVRQKVEEETRDAAEKSQRYTKVLKELKALEFSDNLMHLRKNALEWIEGDLERYGKVSEYYTKELNVSLQEWKNALIKQAQWGITYHEREIKRELAVRAEQLKFLSDLVELVGLPPQGLK